MAKFTTPPVSFNLLCEFTCCTQEIYDWTVEDVIETRYGLIKEAPKTMTKTVRFDFDIPEGAEIVKAQVYADVGLPQAPLYGSKMSTINGVEVGAGCTACVDVGIPAGAAAVDVQFQFLCNTPSHQHEPTGSHFTTVWKTETQQCDEYYYTHESSMDYTKVYLLIEYTNPFVPPVLNPYTDPRLYVGETYVKAVHMTELHTNANLVRTAYRLPEYAFPPIVARESLLARWNEDVIELRVALDEIGVEHEDWLVLDFNCPRLDVLLQLRRVVAALAAGDGGQEETDGAQLYTADGEQLMDANGMYIKAWEGN